MPDFAVPDVQARWRPDGCIVLESRQALSAHPPTVLAWLAAAADRHRGRALLCERDAGGSWQRLEYGAALDAVERAAAAWLAAGLVAGERVLVLARNGAGHLVASLSALRAGLVTCPLGPRLAQGAGLARLAEIVAVVHPQAAFLEDPAAAPEAVALLRANGVRIASLAGGADIDLARACGSATLPPLPAGEDPARIIFTSGSVGAPKGVLYTHAMMTANLQMTLDLWRFLHERPLVLLDWLPWHHVFGGNNNVNLVLALAGTLYVDTGAPTREGIATTVRNLREVSPTLYCSVPSGLGALLPHLQADRALRECFFARLQAIFSAGAALPAPVGQGLRELAAAGGRKVHLLTGWGATETGPGATLVHRADAAALNIGTPTPGTRIKLAPAHGRYELRVQGPCVTPGYLDRPDLTQAAFDEEGYYRSGDAGRLQDERDPALGLVFEGRLAEDFKLANGSWVCAGAVRLDLIRRSQGLVRDAVICGPDRAWVGALVWLSEDAGEQAPQALRTLLASFAGPGGGATTQVARILVAAVPPSAEAGEINEKGYLNQARCLITREAEIARLYADEPAPDPAVLLTPLQQEPIAC